MINPKNILFLILLIVPLLSTAQKKKKLSKSEKKALELYDREFKREGEAFKTATIPEKYASESSVMLAKKVHMVFGRNKKGKTASQIATRKRILLNDMAAVKDYSEFYYQKSDVIGISIIKPDGNKSDVDLDNAVEVTSDIPRQYQDRYHQEDYYKVAIPNLEVGDIVDFYKVFSYPEPSQREFVLPLASSTPILHQELTIDVDKYWTVYYGSLNGAPKFKKVGSGGYNMKGKQSDKVTRLKFEYENAEGKDWERWATVDYYGPMIKLLAAPIKSPLHQKITTFEGLEKVDYITKSMEGVKEITKLLDKNLKSYIKDLNLRDIEESDAAEMIYRGTRVLLLRSMNEVESNDIAVISRGISRERAGISDAVFASIFAKILKKAKIKSEIVLAVDRSAKEDDFLVGQELTMGVYVPKVDKYYWPYDNFSRPGETPYYLEGLKVIRIPYSKVFKDEAAQFVKSSVLPTSTLSDNGYKVTAAVNITDDNTLNYKSNSILSGYFRERYSPLFLFNTNYLSEDMSFSEVDKLFGKYIAGFYMQNSTPLARSREEFTEYKKIKDERLTEWLEGEHVALELIEFKIEDYGMMNLDKSLKIGYEFSSDEFIKKAGPNLIFDIGKVSGDQLQLDREELEGRRSDIRIECPKSITTDITITLPEGITAHGLEDLNRTVENEVGRFVCSATQTDNTISLTTTKEYITDNFGAEKWPLMVEFLEAAYEQSQKKVILKRD